MNSVLEISGLHKNYGVIKALDNLSLTVEKGTVHGLLGPNGSGKTTTLGILLGVVRPTSGSFLWFGQAPRDEQRKKIGAILEQPNLIPYLSAIQNLKLIADIKEVDYSQINVVLEKVGLQNRSGSAFRTFSLGMKQRLAIAAALLGSPDVLILDEPTNGLDPQGIAEIRNLILQIAAEGTTVILASHLLDEVQKVCSHVTVLKTGKLLYTGPVKGVRSTSQSLELAAVDMSALEKALGGITGLGAITKEDKILVVENPAILDPATVNTTLHQKGIVLSHLAVRSSNLEKDFLALLASN